MKRDQNRNGGWIGHPPHPKERTMVAHRKLLPWIVVIVSIKAKLTIARR